jgi:uncharacterized RDD family membrane protein YckC
MVTVQRRNNFRDERMNQEIAESVTVTERPADHAGWEFEPVAPWRRYGARMLDSIINGGAGFVLFGFGFALMAPDSADRFFQLFEGPGGRFVDLFATIIVAGLINAIVMGTTGTTLGKSIFGIRVLLSDHSRPGLLACFQREIKVWFFGLAIGLPFISLLSMIMGYQRLTKQKQTLWDEGSFKVVYRPAGSTQTVLNVLGIALIIGGRVALQAL